MNLWRRLSSAARDAHVRRKLAIIIAVTCAAGVLAAGAALFAFQIYVLRSTFLRDFATLADIVANNLSGPVAFNDRKAALEVLDSLRAKPQVDSTLVCTTTGEVFAARGSTAHIERDRTAATGARFEGWHLIVVAPIRVGAETSGSLCLRADFRPTFMRTLRLSALSSAVVCGCALALALAVGRALQGLIVVPVSDLSMAASRIGETRDYNVRVAKHANDELGVLTDAFNRMLERLQAADAELRSANAALTAEIAERQRLQGELVAASRQAGMADVATGVLHNVGNVLNSVNVSAGHMSELLRDSRINLLTQTADLLREKQADLGAFLTQDESGRRVPAFIASLATQITAEHARLTRELAGLASNIEHIKEIVAMQQSYAKASAIIEPVDPRQLIDHALSIHRAAIERHHVTVERDFPAELPHIATDRHKVLQVLTNFVANAIQAVKANPPGHRAVTVSVEQLGAENVQWRVADNGDGIAREHLSKIFQQGFTTRKEGHGFGLHSGALIARALGGTIDAASDGPGTGARFTLRLPLHAPAETVSTS